MVTIDPTTETTRSNSSIIVRDAVFGFGSFKMRGIETVDSGGRFVEFGYFRGIEMSVAFGRCWVGWVMNASEVTCFFFRMYRDTSFSILYFWDCSLCLL